MVLLNLFRFYFPLVILLYTSITLIRAIRQSLKIRADMTGESVEMQNQFKENALTKCLIIIVIIFIISYSLDQVIELCLFLLPSSTSDTCIFQEHLMAMNRFSKLINSAPNFII